MLIFCAFDGLSSGYDTSKKEGTHGKDVSTVEKLTPN